MTATTSSPNAPGRGRLPSGRRFAAAGLVVAVGGALVWARRDHAAWRALGTGGVPPTWRGWLRITRLRLRKTDPLATDAAPFRLIDSDDPDRLAALPQRRGRRPRVGPHPVPHRQLTDHAAPATIAALGRAFDARVSADPRRLDYALSHFERHNDAVTLRPGCRCGADARLTRGEIGHIHPSDGSMHIVLGVRDTRTVIERGWGERHGLAGIALGLPATYTLIYAPRDEADVAVAGRILDAAIDHMAATI